MIMLFPENHQEKVTWDASGGAGTFLAICANFERRMEYSKEIVLLSHTFSQTQGGITFLSGNSGTFRLSCEWKTDKWCEVDHPWFCWFHTSSGLFCSALFEKLQPDFPMAAVKTIQRTDTTHNAVRNFPKSNACSFLQLQFVFLGHTIFCIFKWKLTRRVISHVLLLHDGTISTCKIRTSIALISELKTTRNKATTNLFQTLMGWTIFSTFNEAHTKMMAVFHFEFHILQINKCASPICCCFPNCMCLLEHMVQLWRKLIKLNCTIVLILDHHSNQVQVILNFVTVELNVGACMTSLLCVSGALGGSENVLLVVDVVALKHRLWVCPPS